MAEALGAAIAAETGSPALHEASIDLVQQQAFAVMARRFAALPALHTQLMSWIRGDPAGQGVMNREPRLPA